MRRTKMELNQQRHYNGWWLGRDTDRAVERVLFHHTHTQNTVFPASRISWNDPKHKKFDGSTKLTVVKCREFGARIS